MKQLKQWLVLSLGLLSFALPVHMLQRAGAQVTVSGQLLAMPGGGDWEPEPDNGPNAVKPLT